MDDGRGSIGVAYRAVLLAAGLLLLGLLFHELVTLLLAVLITVIIAIGLSAATDVLERRSVPRPIGAFVALAAGLGVVVGIFALIIPAFVDSANEFADNFEGNINNLQEQVRELTGAEAGEITARVEEFAQRYLDDPTQLIGPLASVGLGVAGVLAALLLVLVTAYFIAVDPAPMVDGLRRLVPPAHRRRADEIMARLRSAWIGWTQGVAVDILVTGILLYIGLRLIGLDFAIFFAVLAALFCVIPYFGAIAGGLPPTLFALTASPGKALLVILVYTIVQQVESNVTIPVVMSRTVRLHPAVIAIGVVVVGQLFGILGLVVAVPILSLIVILVDELWVKPIEVAEPVGPVAEPVGPTSTA